MSVLVKKNNAGKVIGYVAVVTYRDADGKRRQVRKNATKFREAEQIERDFENQRARGELRNRRDIQTESATPGALTVSRWFDRWLASYREDHPTSRTPNTYASLLSKYVTPVIGSMPLAGIDPDAIRSVIRSKAMQAVSGTTRLHVYRVLFQALKAAVWDGHLDRNPCERVKAPEADRFEPHVITLTQGRRLIELSAGTEIGALIVLLSYTGLRLGEALGLRWGDVDFDGATLYVRQSRKINAPVTYGEPKTASSKASVPLVSVVVEALTAHHEAQRAHYAMYQLAPDHDLVFTDPLGRGMTHDFVTHRWQTLRERTGVPKARIHDLRHFTGTLLISLGVDPVTVAAILRHSSPMITLTRYAHVVPNATREAAERLATAIGAK
jgi:integrase